MMDIKVIDNGTPDVMPLSSVGSISPTVIKVIGCGGCGCNAVNNMISSGISGVDFISVNTDVQSLYENKAPTRIQIGKKITGGLGAGMHPEVGEAAAREEEESIKKLLKGTNMVFITAGLGGGTGTGSAPIVAKIAKELGILTVGVVTTPFAYEGAVRMSVAQEGLKKLRDQVDSLIVIPNQRVFEGEDKKCSVKHAFEIIDDILRQAVKGISDIITLTGLVNRDFHDVESVMRGQGDAILGIGVGEGDNRAVDAATNAISNKLLEDTRIDGAKNVLIGIFGNEDVGMDECEEISKIVTASADKNVRVFWGFYIDPSMGDKISATVIATGFHSPSAANENEVIAEKAAEPEDPNTVAPDIIGNIINGTSGSNAPVNIVSPVAKPEVFEQELFGTKQETPEPVPTDTGAANKGDLSKALGESSYGSRGQWIGGDISRPAVVRKAQNGLSRTINFGDR